MQFSLSAALGLMLLVGVMVALAKQFILSGAQTAFEELLVLVWLLSLVISFRKSVARGWKRILETTVITAAVWSVLVFGTHLMFVPEMAAFGVSWLALLVRSAVLSLLGAAAALAGACLLQVTVLVGRLWRSCAWQARVACAVISISIPSVLLLWWNYVCTAPWQPAVTRSTAEPIVAPRAQATLLGQGQIDRLEQSPDGRFVADWSYSDRTRNYAIQIHDAVSLAIKAELSIPHGQVFQSMTFLPDSGILAAIFVNDRWERTLIRWRTDTWKEEGRASLDVLLGRSRQGSTYPILTDNTLLLVHVDDIHPSRTKLEFSTAELHENPWSPKQFSSMTVDLPKRIPRSVLTEQLYSHSEDRSFPSRWMMSPKRNCIISGPHAFGETGRFARDDRWLFRRGVDHPLKLPGDPLGFLCDGDFIVVRESSYQYVVSRKSRRSDVPPFWDLPQPGSRYRVSVLDCMTGKPLLQSGWWSCTAPRLDESRSQITASYGGHLLTWNLGTNGLRFMPGK
jgi:hypothetical protein